MRAAWCTIDGPHLQHHDGRRMKPDCDGEPEPSNEAEQEFALTIADPAGGWGASVRGYGEHPDGWDAVARRVSGAFDPRLDSGGEL